VLRTHKNQIAFSYILNKFTLLKHKIELQKTKIVLENPECMVTIISTRQVKMLLSCKIHNLFCVVSARDLKAGGTSFLFHVKSYELST
jgi:hypothetical protein